MGRSTVCFGNVQFLYCSCPNVGRSCPPLTEQAWDGDVAKGITARSAVRLTVPSEPVIAADFGHRTILVFIVNVASVSAADTVTLGGTVATELLLLESATTAPPAGAGPLSVTVPVEEFLPVTLGGFNVSEVRTGGSTVIVVVCVTPPNAAVITAVVFAATGLVVTVNVVLVVPSGMVTVAGTPTDRSLLDKEITAPPVGAAPFIVRVPVDELPPVTSTEPKPNADGEMTAPRLYTMLCPLPAVASSHARLMFPPGSVTIVGRYA